jgi:hypothetical protein
MRLTVMDVDQPIEGPTVAQVQRAVREAGGRGVVLESAEGHYLRAAREGEGPLILEYRDGSPARHFATYDYRLADPGTTEVLVDVFTSYLNQDQRWRTMVEWHPLDLPDGGEPRARQRRVWPIWVALALVLVALVVAYLIS